MKIQIENGIGRRRRNGFSRASRVSLWGASLLRGPLLRVWIISLLLAWPAAAAVSSPDPLDEYAARLNQAETIADRLTEGEPTAGQVRSSMNRIKELLPSLEEIELDGRTLKVDNSWLSEAVTEVIKNADGDVEPRRWLLVGIVDRLITLQERVKAARSEPAANGPNSQDPARAASPEDRHGQLEQILARPEYQSEKVKESKISSFFRMLFDALKDFLKLFESKQSPGTVMETGGIAVWPRILMMLVVLAAAAFGIVFLIGYLANRRRPRRERGSREVLGEVIDENVTASDLLSKASELARQGDYRAAIRRAYLSLLFEMEHRGQLKLHRSKTNRDYLNDLRPVHDVFQPFSAMTRIFERVWYGQTPATEDEFNGFLSRYQETLK